MGIQEFISNHAPSKIVYQVTDGKPCAPANVIDVNKRISEVAARHGLEVDDLKSKHRFPHLIRPRFEAYRAVRELGWSYPRIGRYFGGRDHTSVMHGIRRLEEMETKEAQDA